MRKRGRGGESNCSRFPMHMYRNAGVAIKPWVEIIEAYFKIMISCFALVLCFIGIEETVTLILYNIFQTFSHSLSSARNNRL